MQGTIRQQDWKIDRLTKENRALEARLLDQRNQIQAVQAENLEVSEKIVKLDADLQSQLVSQQDLLWKGSVLLWRSEPASGGMANSRRYDTACHT